MSDQLVLVFDGTTAARFEEFHRHNPIVYTTLCRLAREWVNANGRTKVGIRMLWEVARWELIKATRNSDYKLNDHYTSYYVRLMMRRERDLNGLFELRQSPADEWIDHYMASAS